MQHILLTQCPDQPGLIATITKACSIDNLNIIKNNEFVDAHTKTFFMRTVLQTEHPFDEHAFLNKLSCELPKKAQCRLARKTKKRIVILASKEAHCLSNILIKHYTGVLDIDIAAIISNHDMLSPLSMKFDIPFHFVSHESKDRKVHEEEILSLLKKYQADYIVLAKYMRILSAEFVQQFPGNMINIHHSFLPAFIGASPYKQAFDRGVKMIGATAHFVNNELDQGPIIEQNVIQVDHGYLPEKLAQAGQQLEESVLLNALQKVLNEKVIIHGNRTIVFS